MINHPVHYNAGKYEVIDIIEDQGWGTGFNRGNVVKYILRAGIKNPDKEIEDLEKARWYIDREIARLKTIKTNYSNESIMTKSAWASAKEINKIYLPRKTNEERIWENGKEIE